MYRSLLNAEVPVSQVTDTAECTLSSATKRVKQLANSLQEYQLSRDLLVEPIFIKKRCSIFQSLSMAFEPLTALEVIKREAIEEQTSRSQVN